MQTLALFVSFYLSDHAHREALLRGVIVGVWLAWLPTASLVWALALFVWGVLPVQRAVALMSFLLFWVFRSPSLFHQVGLNLLSKDSLQPLWEFFYAAPVLAFLNLNNSQVLGSLVCTLMFSPLLYFVLNHHLLDRAITQAKKISRSPFMAAFYGSSFFLRLQALRDKQ